MSWSLPCQGYTSRVTDQDRRRPGPLLFIVALVLIVGGLAVASGISFLTCPSCDGVGHLGKKYPSHAGPLECSGCEKKGKVSPIRMLEFRRANR